MKGKIKIYKMSEFATVPHKGSPHSVGWDIRADLSRLAIQEYKSKLFNASFEEFLEDFAVSIMPQEVKVLPTGLKVELEEDMEMDIKARSGLFSREGILSVGTIDPDYRGEIGIMMINLGKKEIEIKHGERLAQAVVRRVYNKDDLFTEVEKENDLSSTKRGQGGFGSTGKK